MTREKPARRFGPKHKLAIHYYLTDPYRDLGQAWINAFQDEDSNPISLDTAIRSFEAMSNWPEARKYLTQSMEKLAQRDGVSEEDVIKEWALIGFLDPIGMFAPDGSLLPMREIPPSIRRAIASYDVTQALDGGMKIRIKLHSKLKALSDLANSMGMFKKVSEYKLTWMDGASEEDKIKMRDHIQQEIERRMLEDMRDNGDISH